MNLECKRVLVTGGSGFLGSHIVDSLHRHGCIEVVVPSHKVMIFADVKKFLRCTVH